MDSEGMDAKVDDVERLLADSFDPSHHDAVREQLARLEPMQPLTSPADDETRF